MSDSYHIDFGIWGSIFPVPCSIADRHIKLCTEKQLKVLLLALREGKSPVDLSAIARRLCIGQEEAADCLDYWRAAGVFTQAGDAPSLSSAPVRQDSVPADKPAPAPAPQEDPAEDGPTPAPAPSLAREAGGETPNQADPSLREEQTVKGQRITTVHSRARLTPSQQNQLIREDPEIPPLLQLLQEILSRPLTPYETEGFLYLYSGLRLSASFLLMAVQYSREQGKDSIRQIERLVTSWVEKGIDTHERAEEEIKRLAKNREDERTVRELFGIHDRNLSAKEKGYIEHWFTDLGYDGQLIGLAYERTVDNTGKVSFPYLNKILNRWHEKGIATPAEAMTEMESGTKKKPSRGGAPDRETSYDLEEIKKFIEENSGG